MSYKLLTNGLGATGFDAKLDAFKQRAEAVLRRVEGQGRPEAANYIRTSIQMLESQRSELQALSPQEQDFFIAQVEARFRNWENPSGAPPGRRPPSSSAPSTPSPTATTSSTSSSSGGLPGWAWVVGGLAVAGGLYYASQK